MNANNKNNDNGSKPTQTLQHISADNSKAHALAVAEAKAEILRTYSVRRAMEVSADKDKCLFGSAPVLWDINRQIGRGTSEEWLVYHLADLCEYAGAREKMTGNQIKQVAELIAADFGFLKVTEVVLFLRRMKCGCYGTFYGTVDPFIIMGALRNFVVERNAMIAQREEERLKKAIATAKTGAVSYEEYLKAKASQQ